MIYSNKKRFISTILLMTMFLSMISISTNVNAAGRSDIILNGNKLNLDVRPLSVDGRIYVPIRAILEDLGMNVTWDSNTNTVIGEKQGNILRIPIRNNYAVDNTYNGVTFYNEHAPTIARNGRTLVPVRGVANILGLNVRWDATNQDVILNETPTKGVTLKEAHKIVTDKYPVNESGFKFEYIYLTFGGYAARDNYVLDNYYVFAIISPYEDVDDYGNTIMDSNAWDANYCVDKETGEMKMYDPMYNLIDLDFFD